MFGNKFAAEELAKNFHNRMTKLTSMKKEASTSKVAEVSPEDFLVEPAEEVDVHGTDLEDKILEIDSYAKDKCEKCGKSEEFKGSIDDCDRFCRECFKTFPRWILRSLFRAAGSGSQGRTNLTERILGTPSSRKWKSAG